MKQLESKLNSPSRELPHRQSSSASSVSVKRDKTLVIKDNLIGMTHSKEQEERLKKETVETMMDQMTTHQRKTIRKLSLVSLIHFLPWLQSLLELLW